MFGVLIVVLSPDRITDLGFSTGKCQILLIGSLRVLRSLARDARRSTSTGSSVLVTAPVRIGAHAWFALSHFAWLTPW